MTASPIAKLLQEFGSKMGLSSSLELGEDRTVRLNLSDDFGIDFEEEESTEILWMYTELFPGLDRTQGEHLFTLLRLMFTYHRTVDASLTIDPHGFQIILVSSFSIPKQADESALDLFDQHLERFVTLVETLRASVHEKEEHYQDNISINTQLA